MPAPRRAVAVTVPTPRFALLSEFSAPRPVSAQGHSDMYNAERAGITWLQKLHMKN
jgi:hypothetical protein